MVAGERRGRVASCNVRAVMAPPELGNTAQSSSRTTRQVSSLLLLVRPGSVFPGIPPLRPLQGFDGPLCWSASIAGPATYMRATFVCYQPAAHRDKTHLN